MWTVIKFKKKNLELLKKDLKKKVGQDCSFYLPKILVQKYVKNKLINKEKLMLGDYLFCFHKNFEKKNFINQLKFLKGLKYFLNDFLNFQKDIKNFIAYCKQNENKDGFILRNLIDLNINTNYKFISGPFVDKIFKITEIEKFKINVSMGKIKAKIDKKKYSFYPL